MGLLHLALNSSFLCKQLAQRLILRIDLLVAATQLDFQKELAVAESADFATGRRFLGLGLEGPRPLQTVLAVGVHAELAVMDVFSTFEFVTAGNAFW